ncbi:cytochrome C oxidase subunit IV family protein [Halomarina ordinaria]|uniref:Cytochrome C oxidase subunit IV family protein n=1 Tax=Halomarina ordinaria TaxID=3033939 RepID=A0ABD5U4L6_9EURY|nr:cytochrome C oxidase subunit IV family protein [Halomarina sp. PSRA2]
MNAKGYTLVYVVLFVAATAQVLVEFAGLAYWTAFGAIIGLSAAKALLVAGYYQHLVSEPRSVSYVVLTGLLAALALTLAAAYSIS